MKKESNMLSIRVSRETKAKLKLLAAYNDMTLTDYVKSAIKKDIAIELDRIKREEEIQKIINTPDFP